MLSTFYMPPTLRRYKQHQTDFETIPTERPILLPCRVKGCHCAAYHYVPLNGGQPIRCTCKHMADEHGVKHPYVCKKGRKLVLKRDGQVHSSHLCTGWKLEVTTTLHHQWHSAHQCWHTALVTSVSRLKKQRWQPHFTCTVTTPVVTYGTRHNCVQVES